MKCIKYTLLIIYIIGIVLVFSLEIVYRLVLKNHKSKESEGKQKYESLIGTSQVWLAMVGVDFIIVGCMLALLIHSLKLYWMGSRQSKTPGQKGYTMDSGFLVFLVLTTTL